MNQLAFSAENFTESVWGKVEKLRDGKSINGFTYFVTFNKDGVKHAFPIKADRKISKSDLDKNTGKLARINGKIEKVTQNIDGQTKQYYFFKLGTIKPMTLKDLSANKVLANSKNIQNQDLSLVKKEKYDGGGFEVSDEVANTAIFISGAALVGSILLKYLK
jgi:hypothetical protein